MNTINIGSGENTTVYISPETIIKGKFAILNPNIFEEITTETPEEGSDPANDKYYDTSVVNRDGTLGDSALSKMIEGRTELRNTISGWYYALRNFAIIALLSILVYVGIRMIISTLSQDKAKYKMMLRDWLVALCLVMVMHYIMIGTLNITSSIVDAIGTTGKNSNTIEKLMTKIQNINQSTKEDHEIYLDENGEKLEESMGGKLYTIGDAFAYELVLLGVIGYTLIFAFKYLLRMMTIVFLILVAPITAVTYPIDKISDGKAQAFNMWLQEFIYEVIIQPFHLLIYVVLIGSATTLASTNVLYSIMCFAVMIPAEKFIKQMFGFKDKLGSPLGAAFAGGAAGNLLSKAFSGGGSSSSDKSPKVEGKSESDDSFRENKLKTGLPGGDEGAGTPTTYDSDDNQENTDTSEQTGNEEEGPRREVINPPGAEDEETGPEREVINPPGAEDEETGPEREVINPSRTDKEEDNAGAGAEPEPEPQTTGIYNPNSKVNKFKNAVSAVRERRDKTLMAKYGTKNRGYALAKYAGKKGAKYGKKAIKGATTLAGAAALGLVGTMFGQGKAGLAAGATFGANMGNKLNDKISSGYKNAKAYGKDAIYATKDEETRRKEKVKEMMKTPDQIEKASRSFSKRNNGKIANREELNQELEDRARFKETGLTDSQIDDAMEIYHDNIEELGDDTAFKMAYSSARLADRYKASDFLDEKKMKSEYTNMMKEYEALGVNQDLADENVRAILGNAAATHKVKNPALPTPSRKEAYKADENNKKKAEESFAKRQARKGKTGKDLKPNKKQQDHELEMGYNLRKAGINEEDRAKFYDDYLMNDDARKEAQVSLGIEGDDLTEEQEMMVDDELERRFEVKIKTGMFEETKKADGTIDVSRKQAEEKLTAYIKESEKFIKENTKVEKPSNGQVYTEIKHRLQVKDSYHVSDSEISKIRKSEEEFVRKSTDKDGAKAVIAAQRAEAKYAISDAIGRETTVKKQKAAEQAESKKRVTMAQCQRDLMATHSVEEMKNPKDMNKAAKKIIKKVEDAGLGYSTELAQGFAEHVINSSREMVGIEGIEAYKFKKD